MLYWYTGQPGHGKTLNAIDRVLRMKEEADKQHRDQPAKYPLRELYVCNVRDFDYAKTGALEMTPEMFKAWADGPEYVRRRDAIEAQRRDGYINEKQQAKLLEELELDDCATLECDPRFENAIMLIDEAYEHGMLPKRPPSSAVPRHVQRIAKHRHHGLDIVGVCQSPDTQCDAFVRDLIDEHIHVRRMFGTQRVQLRIFDKFEAQAEKRTPLQTKLIHLTKGKKSVGTYKSTVFDTTQRRIPWYYYALGIGGPIGLVFVVYVFMGLGDRLGGADGADHPPPAVTQSGVGAANGANATVAAPPAAQPMTVEEYAARFTPRVPSQPWSAPAYDNLAIPAQPPRMFCMSSLGGETADGSYKEPTCGCMTEQGTRYLLETASCLLVAKQGQYEPYRQNRIGDDYRMDAQQLGQRYQADAHQAYALRDGGNAQPGGTWTMPTYGDYGIETGRYQVQSIR